MAILLVRPGSAGPLPLSLPAPPFKYIAVIVMENKTPQAILDDNRAPYFASLYQKYKFTGDYRAVAHPSLPNYLALLSGSTQGVTSDCADCFTSSTNLVDSLEVKNISWRAYMDSLPQSCFVGDAPPYAQKHDPFIYFDDIRTDPARCANVVPFDQLSADISNNSLPQFIFITPNLCHDMHDCSVTEGDRWLSSNLPQLLQSPQFQSGNFLVAVTADEGTGANRVPLLLISASARPSPVKNTAYTHYSLLHTIENNFSLSPLTQNDRNAPLINFVRN